MTKKNEQHYKKVLRNDIRYSQNGLYRINSPIGRFPPDNDYVLIKPSIPENTKQFFQLCKENRLLEGIIQFHSFYYSDEAYKAFIDANAKRWFGLLDALEGFWREGINAYGDEEFRGRIEFAYIEDDEYTKIKWQIRYELAEFEAKKQKILKEKIDADMGETLSKAIGYKGEARFGGRDIPKKIEETAIDNDIDFLC